MSTASRVAKNTIFLYVRIIVNVIISLYSTRLILDALGVEDFGIYNLVAGVIAMLGFLNGSMAEASVRFMAFAHGEDNFQKQKTIFNISIILHIAIAIIVILILEVVGIYIFSGVLEIPEDRLKVAKIIYQFMLVSTFFTIVKVPYDAVLKANENMMVIAVLGIVQTLLRLGIAVYITFTTLDKLVVYGLLMALLSVVTIVAFYVYCHIKYEEAKFGFKSNFDKHLLKEMGSFAGWSFLTNSSYIITMQGTTLVLNKFFGVIVNAAQGIANQVSSQLSNFSMTMQLALDPVIIKNEGRKDRNKMLEASMFGNKATFFILSFLSIPVLIEMPYIFDLWLKDVPDYAVVFCRLSLIRLILGALTHSFFVAIGAIGDIRKYSIWESLLFFSVLPISFFMYKNGAPPETIYTVLVFMGIGISVTRVYFLNKLGGMSIAVFMKNVVARSVSVFVIVFLVSFLISKLLPENIIRLISVFITSSVVFLFITYFLGLNNDEKKLIRKVVMNFFTKKIQRQQ